MNRQVNYIIYALLLSLSIPVGYFLIKKIVLTEMASQGQVSVIDNIGPTKSVTISKSVSLGKSLFNSKCAACHSIFKLTTGPGLMGFEERGPWSDRQQLYAWIRNPVAFMKTNKYTQDLKAACGSMMQSFPDIKNEEVDAIVDFINFETQVNSQPIAAK